MIESHASSSSGRVSSGSGASVSARTLHMADSEVGPASEVAFTDEFGSDCYW